MRPDYTTARANAGFSWSVGGTQGALRTLTQPPIRDFNLKPEACIDAYRRGRPMLREMYGDEVGTVGLATPAVSYGHVSCLGSELLFPEGGELAHTHIYGSLEQGIAALREPCDWASEGMAPYYLDFKAKMEEAFPGEKVGFSFGLEGPITTAYELRGEGFFLDIHDNPPLAREFLRATVDSVLDFHQFLCEADDRPVINPGAAGLCDDLASFISPALFGEMVVPYWDQHYGGMTTGARYIHAEDLRPEQLPFLEDAGIARFDPSISEKLHPRLIRDHCRVPFQWRLGCFHYSEMSVQEVEDFVFQSAADGACGVMTYVAETMCDDIHVQKVHAFIRAAKEAKQLVVEGCPLSELADRVSPEGRRKLWEGWCGFLSPRSSRGGAAA